MGPRPWKPAVELEGALDRGDLHYAMTLADELRVEHGAVQVQRWLGHSDPGFTLRTYVHLLNDDLGEPLGLPKGVSEVSAGHTPADATALSEIEVLAA
jgi:hypothetical protein